ncbi:hypothetical protein WG68_00425 [Arsukibacterium ikkense]|uniref:Lipoprotein n=1 Tax=Arsukibacterium ikkense TaxID=336831 RepID=A0A0M2V980_9GAMM|nr:hypothetical protein [Arsukibacterium ikkense]KKO47156.1 hypothetical protein WG68_00425 [Arsukibacterium ikkense]
MRFFLVFIGLFIVGCSSSTSSKSDNLASYFAEYKASVATQAEQQFVKAELWQTLVTARAAAETSELVNAIAYFPLEMAVTTDTKQAINGQQGCLLISGTNAKQTPLDYYIQFDLTDNQWLISDVAIKYFLDGSERYLTYAECDAEKRMALWLESVQ